MNYPKEMATDAERLAFCYAAQDIKDLDLGMAAPPSGPPPALLSSEGV